MSSTKNEARIRARIRVFLMLIPYHFDLFKCVILFLVQNFASRRKARYHLYFRLKKPLPYFLEYAKDQRNWWGVSRKQFLTIFTRATYLTYPAREFIYAPSYPYRKLTKTLTSEGHIFDQELAFHLLEVSCPMFYFVLKTISINKECLEVQNMNAPTSIPILGRTTGIKDKSRLEKIIHKLGC